MTDQLLQQAAGTAVELLVAGLMTAAVKYLRSISDSIKSLNRGLDEARNAATSHFHADDLRFKAADERMNGLESRVERLEDHALNGEVA